MLLLFETFFFFFFLSRMSYSGARAPKNYGDTGSSAATSMLVFRSYFYDLYRLPLRILGAAPDEDTPNTTTYNDPVVFDIVLQLF